MEFDKKHFSFKHPCNALVTGPSGSGKTQLIRKFLSTKNLFSNIQGNKLRVLWAYGQWQPLLDVKISNNVKVYLIDKIPDEKELLRFKPDILIIDDFMFEMQSHKEFEMLFTKKSHHLNISIFFLVQNPNYYAKTMRTITLNCHYIIYMKNPRDQSQIHTMAKQTALKHLPHAYFDATSEPFGYLRIDMTSDTPEELRLMSKIESVPIIYLKNE